MLHAGEVRRVMSLRNPLQKMSKSDNQELSRINLTDSSDEIRNKVRKAVTDSTGRITYDQTTRPGVSNLVSIYAAISGLNHSETCERFEGKQTVDFKDELAEILVERLSPIREKIAQLEENMDYVEGILREGSEKATAIAEENLNEIKRLVGIL